MTKANRPAKKADRSQMVLLDETQTAIHIRMMGTFRKKAGLTFAYRQVILKSEYYCPGINFFGALFFK